VPDDPQNLFYCEFCRRFQHKLLPIPTAGCRATREDLGVIEALSLIIEEWKEDDVFDLMQTTFPTGAFDLYLGMRCQSCGHHFKPLEPRRFCVLSEICFHAVCKRCGTVQSQLPEVEE
jgi:hypothetical protein